MADDDHDIVDTRLVERPDDASHEVVAIVDAEERLRLAFHARGQAGSQNDGGDHPIIVVASRTTTPTTLPACLRSFDVSAAVRTWRYGIRRRECRGGLISIGCARVVVDISGHVHFARARKAKVCPKADSLTSA